MTTLVEVTGDELRDVGNIVRDAITDSSPRGIAAAVHRLIRAGRLVTGDRLPTVRELALSIDVSPATVSEAWQALSAVGATKSRGRAGTFVQDTREPSRPVRYLGIGVQGGALAALDLSTSMPDPALLPPINAALTEVAGPSLSWTTSYLDNPLLPSLEEILRQDWPFEPQRMGLVDGALDGLARVVEQVVRLGDRVAIENPGFPALMDLLESRGAEVIALEMDGLGVTADSLAAAIREQPVAVFIHPRAQNPTGSSMTEARVRDLSNVMRANAAWIIEADHSGAIASGADVSVGSYLPERTIRIRSYSKSHGPDLRIAAIGGAADVIDPLMARRMLGPGWTSRILQGVLVQLLTSPEAISSVDLARETYRRRSTQFCAFLSANGIQVSAGDGINVWVQVNDERSALITLAAAGIHVAPGGPFMVASSTSSHLRVTAGLLPDDAVRLTRIYENFVIAAKAQPSVRGGIS